MANSLIKTGGQTSVTSNTAVARAILARLQQQGDNYVTVGVHADAGNYEDLTAEGKEPVPVAKVALWIEYGTRYMERRPFLYSTIQAKQRIIAKLVAQAEQAVVAGKATAQRALSSVGAEVQAFVQNALSSNIGPSLSPKYLARRMALFPEAGSRTLIRSGLLLRSIGFKVWSKGQVVSASETGQDNGAHGASPDRARGRQDMRAQRNLHRQQREAAKADPLGTKARFDAQRRVRPERT